MYFTISYKSEIIVARTTSVFFQALLYLEIIKRLPQHWVTSTEIMSSLISTSIETLTPQLAKINSEIFEIPISRKNSQNIRSPI